VKMLYPVVFLAYVLASNLGLAAPAAGLITSDLATQDGSLYKRENLCSLKAPPALCQPNASVTVEETAMRAYKFYRAFVVDGDPKTMFSLIDSVYKASSGYSSPLQGTSDLYSEGCRSANDELSI
jgi:hypothetical protein